MHTVDDVEPAAQWRPVAHHLAELTGETLRSRTVRKWARAGLQTICGRRGQLLCTRAGLLDFLRGRTSRLTKSSS